MTYIVRNARGTDAAAIGEAHAEAWRVAYQHRFPAELVTEGVRERRALWQHLLTGQELDGTLLVIEHASAGVVGFNHAGPSGADYLKAHHNAGRLHTRLGHCRAFGESG